jgi:hypothetical protein
MAVALTTKFDRCAPHFDSRLLGEDETAIGRTSIIVDENSNSFGASLNGPRFDRQTSVSDWELGQVFHQTL